MSKLIVNVALTGCVHYRHNNLDLPITPDEIARDVLRCHNAGASMFHIHARDSMENPTYQASVYHNIITKVRELVSDAVIVASCSGRIHKTFEERSEVLNLKSVDMASLTVGSFNFPYSASVNDPTMIEALAKKMLKEDIKPELECFELGHVAYLHHLIHRGHIELPLYVNLLLGNRGSIPANMRHLMDMIELLPERTLWAGAGIGRFQYNVNRWSIGLGGHVRVGLEDSLMMDAGELATNVKQVERIVELGRAFGREPASCNEVREWLQIPKR